MDLKKRFTLIAVLLCAWRLQAAGLVFSNAPSVGVALYATAYSPAAGNFVGVGASSTAVNSTIPGGSWAATSLPGSSETIAAITYGGGMFVAAGGPNTAAISSTNGTAGTWSAHGSVFSASQSVAGLAYNTGGSGTFAAVSSLGAISYSSGGNLGSWTAASIPNSSGFEIYYAVTALDTSGNSFATCGNGGLVRVSTDSGHTWGVIIAYNPSDDVYHLKGVASGGGKLVAVGTGTSGSGGSILVLNESTWATVANVPESAALNAVAYTGSGFIAVGNSGTILTSSNGTTWTASPSPTTANLFGVAFGTSGSLSNIAVLVGSGGHIVIGGYLPTAAAFGTNTVCNGGPVVAQAKLGGSAGPWNVTWASNSVAVVTQTNVGTIDSFTNAPFNPGSTPVNITYTVTKVVDTKSLFSGPGITGNVVSTVNPTPTVNAVGNEAQTVCNGTAIAPVSFSGVATSYQWVNNTPAIGLAASGVNTISFNATNSGTTPLTATITVVPHYLNNGVDCTGAATNVYVTVNPTPVVSVVANEAQTVCNGTAIAPVSFSGVATSYQWVNDTPAIGLAASGTNSIPAFVATNSGSTPLTATITVVPHYLNNGMDCAGAATNVTLTVQVCPFSLNMTLVNSNPVVSWFGNYVLESSTNLRPPWLVLTQGTGGVTNYWPQSMVAFPPFNFFRLYAPTN